MKRILLLSLIYFICFSVSKGQDDKPVISSSKDWTIWEEIYNYKGLVVEISFSLFDCDSTQKQSKFKYQVTGNL